MFINDEEPVVESFEGMDCYWRVLGVVLFEIQRELATDFPRENSGAGGRLALGKHQHDGLVHIIVQKNDRTFRFPDERGYKRIGIENLAVEKDALRGRLVAVAFQCGKNLLKFLSTFRNKLDLFGFNFFYPLKKEGILKQYPPHFNKRIYDADADLDGCIAMENS